MSDPATIIRLMVIGQELLIAAVFLFGGRQPGRLSGAVLVLGVAAYLFESDPAIRRLLPPIEPLALLFALVVPYALWAFARAVFEFPRPKRIVVALVGAAVLAAWIVYLSAGTLPRRYVEVTNALLHVLSLAVVLHALWSTARGRLDDLLEGRRTFRLLFVALIGAQVIAVLAVELVAGSDTPAWLELVNVVAIALMTFGLAVPILTLNPVFFERSEDRARRADETDRQAISVADRVLNRKLAALMEAGFYREPGLTISRVADEVGYPEHQLRRLINGQLGFRNFSAFLNSYRIEDAKAALSDPERARTPVLTLALDLGYGSVGPFNRAFKAATGMTPTEYRRSELGAERDDSE